MHQHPLFIYPSSSYFRLKLEPAYIVAVALDGAPEAATVKYRGPRGFKLRAARYETRMR